MRVIHNASIMNAIGCCGLQLYRQVAADAESGSSPIAAPRKRPNHRRFGETISIVFFTETWRPDSFYDKIKNNRNLVRLPSAAAAPSFPLADPALRCPQGLHTLCLLDIKVKEPNLEALCRGKKVYEPPRFMTINTALEQLLEIEDRRKEGVYSRETMCIGVARVGADDQRIVAGTMEQLVKARGGSERMTPTIAQLACSSKLISARASQQVDFGAPLHSLVLCGEMHDMEEELIKEFLVQS